MSLISSLFSGSHDGERVRPYLAPHVEGRDQDGRPVKLEEFYKRGLTLVYFYPKADTPGCIAQACSLRDDYEKLTNCGVQVVGVSRDKEASQKTFQAKYHLPFTLLADPEGEIVRAFGVGTFLGFASRQAYLIKDGMVVWRDRHASTQEQAADVLRVVAELAEK